MAERLVALACKICVARYGLRGSDIASLPRTEDELIEHIESVHHMPVRREGETVEQANERFAREHPEAANCQECRERHSPWTTTHT